MLDEKTTTDPVVASVLKKRYTPQEAAGLPGMPSSKYGVRKKAKSEQWEGGNRSGTKAMEYCASQFPLETQIALYLNELKEGEASLGIEELRALECRLVAEEMAQCQGKRGRKAKPSAPPLNADQRESLQDAFEKITTWAQGEARKRLMVVHAYYGLLALDLPEMERKAIIQERFSVSHSSLSRWLKSTRGQDPSDWLALLAPNKKSNARVAEFTPEAWDWIRHEWGTTSRPTIKSVYERAKRIQPERGWSIPKYDTVKKRIAKLPRWWKLLTRYGITAISDLYPAQERDYRAMAVHDLWESDGHKMDVFCRWPDGHVGRPILVVWRDVRTRYVLGWAIGKTESSDLIRLALRKAMKRAGAIPREALMDNGRGYASKLLTGGSATRYRFKVKEEDPLGIINMLGINPVWAQPEHGQSKPIESWFRTVANYVSKHSDFIGAYCGNRPDAKPEDFDSRKAVPIEDVTRRFEIELEHYHQRSHRGQGMNRQSPQFMYEELIKKAQVRTPTEPQLRLCLLKAIKQKLSGNHSVTILDNRYWSEALADLPDRGPYDIRFDPEDATVPVAIYDGDRFLCEAALVEACGFRDQEAAREHGRSRRKFVKARKEQVKAERAMVDAKRWERDAEPDTPGAPPELPVPGVPELVHPKFQASRRPEIPDEESGSSEFERKLNAAVERLLHAD